MNHDEMIKVIEAHKEGKEIQWRVDDEGNDWRSAPCPCWDFSRYEYRVKPIPKKLTIYIYKNLDKEGNIVLLDYLTYADHLKLVKTIETEIE